METKELVNIETGEIKDMTQWELLKEQATTLLKSGFLPSALNTPEKIMTVALKGKELKIPMMEACSSINVIQGKPSVSPQLMLALARRTGELVDLQMESSDKGATVTVTRKGQSPYKSTFGPKEATDLGLIGKDNYKKQPAVMYQWRALAQNLRVTFPDAISGLYLVEEMTGGEETVTTRGPIAMPKPLEQPKPIDTEAIKS